MDFVDDPFFGAPGARILAIIDAVARFPPAVDPRFNWRDRRSPRCSGGPAAKPVFQGRSGRHAVVPDVPPAGKLTENAFIEPLTGIFGNGKFRVERLKIG